MQLLVSDRIKVRLWRFIERLFFTVSGKERDWRKFCRSIKICAGILLFLLAALSFHHDFYCQIVGSLFVFFSGGYLAVCGYPFFRKKRVILMMFLILSIFGILIYHIEEANFIPGTFSERITVSFTSINNMLSTFFPSRGDYVYNNHFCYHLYHILVHFFFGVLLAALWGHRLVCSFYNFIIPERRKFIFWNSGEIPEASVSFAGKLLQHTILMSENKEIYQAQFLVDSTCDDEALLKHYYNAAIEKHFLLKEFDPETQNMDWHEKASTHFFVTEDQVWNIRMAQRLVKVICNKKNAADYQPKIYIKIGDGNICEMISDWADHVKEAEIILLKEYSLIAQTFTVEHPVLRTPGITIARTQEDKISVNGEFRLLLLGFGWLGKEILKECVCDSQFQGLTFSADIADADSCKFERFQEQCNTAVKKYNLLFQKENVLSASFSQWMKYGNSNGHKLSSYSRVIICLGDDMLNIETAVYLLKIARELGKEKELRSHLFVRCSDTSLKECYKELFYSFGERSTIYDLMLDDRIERNAIMMNYYWAWEKGPVDMAAAWRAESLFSRESSRASAIGSRNLLRLAYAPESPDSIDKKLNDKNSSFRELFPDFFDKISLNLKYLAETEHLRWNAYHLMRGVQPLPLDELKQFTDKKPKANHLKDRNCHAAIVPFDELPAVDSYLSNIPPENLKMLDLQKNDVNFIIYLPAIAEQSNKKRIHVLESLLEILNKQDYFPELQPCIGKYIQDCKTKISWIRNKTGNV